ncbi:MAG: hypothetical protein M3140_11600 [Actinomycetota bacterium]|nr:hypothetical protein [Actinomycetota bacterium]
MSADRRMTTDPPSPVDPPPAVDEGEHERALRDAERATRIPPVATPLPGLPLPRWFAALVALAATGLIPWIVYLAVDLPEESRVANYDVGWIGFDVAMFAVLVAVTVTAVRRTVWVEPLATIAATMLVIDAWFDVVSAPTSADRLLAVASAVVVELPLALICAWVAQNTERLRRREFRRLWYRVGAQDRA